MVVLEQGVLSEADAAVRRRGVLPEVGFQEIKGHLPPPWLINQLHDRIKRTCSELALNMVS